MVMKKIHCLQQIVFSGQHRTIRQAKAILFLCSHHADGLRGAGAGKDIQSPLTDAFIGYHTLVLAGST